MLRAVPKGLFSWRFAVYDEAGEEVARLHQSSFREKGSITVNGVECTISREPGWGAFMLEAGGDELARAVKPSAFVRRFEISYDGQDYSLQARSAFTRTFVLRRGEEAIGTVSAEHPFTRKAQVNLPETLPLAIRLFLLWLVLMSWKRAADSS